MARGGKRPGAGRRKGARNKVTADIKAICQQHGSAAVERLVTIMQSTTAPEAAVISAAREILDRAYGKPTQHIGGDKENPMNVAFTFKLARPGERG